MPIHRYIQNLNLPRRVYHDSGTLSDIAPQFPQFEPLSLEQSGHIETMTSRFHPYSDFNFTSLFSWNTNNLVAHSMHEGNLIVRFADYLTGEPVYSFLGDTNTDVTAQTILQHMKNEGMKPEIRLLPESSLGNIHPDKFQITEDQDNHDYILSIDRLLQFQGSRLKPNRNLVTRFKKSYQSTTQLLDLTDLSTKKMLIEFFLSWAERKGLPPEQTANELKAMSRALDYCAHKELLGIGIFVDHELAGFTICEKLAGPYAMLHFEKANPARFVGIYQFLMQETAKILANSGCELLNYQQDLGLQGLRMCKKGFHPSHYLRKYKISWIEK